MRSFIVCCCLLYAASGFAQDTTFTKKLIDSINRQLDRAVVNHDIPYLEKHISNDFYFLHATGMTDNKVSWIAKAKNTGGMQLLSREHDSTAVELHDNVALVTGVLTVLFQPGQKRKGYTIRYVRVYALRGQVWQSISHHSTGQWNME